MLMQRKKWKSLARQSQDAGLAPWSFSKMNTLDACPKLFNHTYLQACPTSDKTPETPKEKYQPSVSITGQVSHKILELAMRAAQSAPKPVDLGAIIAEQAKSERLTSWEKAQVLARREDLHFMFNKVQAVVARYGLTSFTEKALYMDAETGEFTDLTVPYKDRLFTVFIDYYGVSNDGKLALILDYKTYKSGKDNKKKNKKRIARDKEQTAFYTLATLSCFPKLQAVQAGCGYLPSREIELQPLKKREKHLHSLHNIFQNKIENSLILVQQCRAKNKFPAKRGKQCTWCTVPKIDCGWAKEV